jgi:phosphatidylglycerophosphate synthase
MNDIPEDGKGSLRSKPSVPDYLNYFGKEKWLQLWFAEKRTKLVSAVFPRFDRLGLVPDTISYIGIALLTGVVLYFVRNPIVAVWFLAGHVICDGLDGAYARNIGRASQSGAFTDLVCDQLGMVVVAMLAIFHHLVAPLVGTVYITLYLIVVVFGVIINVMGLGTRITITSKYFLYVTYLIWAVEEINWFAWMMSFFSVIMAVEVMVGYLRLKRGIRKKFDAEVRFSEGDQYSGKLNYVLNVAVPVAVLLTILIGANIIPIEALVDNPKDSVAWTKEIRLLRDSDESQEIVAAGLWGKTFLILVRNEQGSMRMRRISEDGRDLGFFSIPEYVTPSFKSLPVDGSVALISDSSTRLVMGVDLEASFSAGSAVTVMTLPLGYLRVTGMAVTQWQGKKVWLAANYLYTRKTYVIDPYKALKKGYLLGGVLACYVNGGFPASMTVIGEDVFELNQSMFKSIIYCASLKKMLQGKDLIGASRCSFQPPVPDAIGPIKDETDLLMIGKDGSTFRVGTSDSFFKKF